MEAKINEIFSSIQGEGPYVGYKQLFIRFCGCNLHCKYCDTEFSSGRLYTPLSLVEKIKTEYDLEKLHSISLTGGEPLLSSCFLAEFLPELSGITKIYLETNATLPDEFLKIKNYTDIVSADIKLPSATGNDTFDIHEKFFNNCAGVETFAKIVFDENITDEEIERCAKLGQKFNIELILQPKTNSDKMCLTSDFCNSVTDKFISIYPKTRLIPQVHKFINVR